MKPILTLSSSVIKKQTYVQYTVNVIFFFRLELYPFDIEKGNFLEYLNACNTSIEQCFILQQFFKKDVKVFSQIQFYAHGSQAEAMNQKQ